VRSRKFCRYNVVAVTALRLGRRVGVPRPFATTGLGGVQSVLGVHSSDAEPYSVCERYAVSWRITFAHAARDGHACRHSVAERHIRFNAKWNTVAVDDGGYDVYTDAHAFTVVNTDTDLEHNAIGNRINNRIFNGDCSMCRHCAADGVATRRYFWNICRQSGNVVCALGRDH